MSPPDSSNKPGGPYRRPRADVYTILLLLALFALLAGILCLYFEMDMYKFELDGGPSVSAQRRIEVVLIQGGTHRADSIHSWMNVVGSQWPVASG